MTEFLVRHFVKDSGNIEKVSVRTSYGILSSIVGVFCNVLLFATKMTIGILLNSISVMADGFNNLSDAGSSIISFIGVKIASKPADDKHPFGHGRIEYISALIVTLLVIQVGFTFFKSSIGKIREPEQLKFQMISVIILTLSIGVKLWLVLFNRKLGSRINSQVMKATAADSLSDVITTSVTILSILFWRFTGINIDGFVGVGVALVVMWAGFSIAKGTLEPLIGEAIDPKIYTRISEFVEQYDGVVGSHDLIVHNYGPGKSMASIHAEVPNNVDIEVSHEIIDRIERDIKSSLGIFLVIHMDPIETENQKVIAVRKQVENAIAMIDARATIHDFRMIEGSGRINLIFDMIVPHEYNREKQGELQVQLIEKLQEIDARYQGVITVEKGFISVNA